MPRTSSPRNTPTTKKKTSPRPRKTTKTTPPRNLAATTPALPRRTRPFMTEIQGHATLASSIAGITTPRITEWVDHHDGTATRPLRDGTLHYNQRTRTLTWQATCRMGAEHTYLINSPGLAHMARVLAARCTQLHHDFTDVEAFTADEHAEFAIWWSRNHQPEPDTDTDTVDTRPTPSWARPHIPGDATTQSIPIPLPGRQPRVLGDTLTHATTTAADTQPISRDDIDAGLAARAAADSDAPKEHPDHA